MRALQVPALLRASAHMPLRADAAPQGMCYTHAWACGGGTCAFLLTKMTRLLAIRKLRCARTSAGAACACVLDLGRSGPALPCPAPLPLTCLCCLPRWLPAAGPPS